MIENLEWYPFNDYNWNTVQDKINEIIDTINNLEERIEVIEQRKVKNE